MVSEIWGERRANFMVMIDAMSVLMLGIVTLALVVPAHIYWVAPDNPLATPMSKSTATLVFGQRKAGSMLAYMVAQLLDVALPLLAKPHQW